MHYHAEKGAQHKALLNLHPAAGPAGLGTLAHNELQYIEVQALSTQQISFHA